MSKKFIYWTCQVIGWLLYTGFSIGMIAIFGGQEAINTSVLILQFIIFLYLLLYSHLFRLFILKQQWISLKVIQLIPRILAGSLSMALIAQASIHATIYLIIPLDGLTPFNWISFSGYVFSVLLVFILWSAVYFSIKLFRKNQQSELEKLALKSALQEAELMVLKNQINPHFLFNALNNIRSLILTDQDRARKMVTHISDLLRYSIQFNASEKVTLEQEIEIVQDYLQLESVQFNDRLTYVINIAEDTRHLKTPPMAIQLLVENAIKHGLSVQKNGGFIRVDSSRESDVLIIKVTNTGQLGIKKNKREGIGLTNLVERMKILFGPFAEFDLRNSSDETVTASLKIPIQ